MNGRQANQPVIPPALLRVVVPMDKRALGVAVGLVAGASIFGLTAFHVALAPTGGLPLGLLAQYFWGYEVSWRGAVVGLLWGFGAGFVCGWLGAFVRNLAVACV